MRSRHKHAERDRLSVSVSKALIGCVWKQQVPPILRKGRQRRAFHGKVFSYLIAEEAAKPGTYDSQLFRIAWWYRLPLKEITENLQQGGRRIEIGSRFLDVAHQMHDRID